MIECNKSKKHILRLKKENLIMTKDQNIFDNNA